MNDLTDDLAALAAPAPERFSDGVFAATGLADRYVQRESVVGAVFVAFGASGVTRCGLASDPAAFEGSYVQAFGRPVVAVKAAPPGLEAGIDRAIASGRPGTLAVDLSRLSDFQQQVLLKTAQIPAGEVRPYGWVAREIGRPGAVRAVGTALAGNPVPLVIPCHRVVRSDGRLGRYSLGDATNKRHLLGSEGLDIATMEELAAQGIRLTGSDTTNIFCFPSCRHARRTMERHQVRFRNERQAKEAGYRPCKVCRPAAIAA